ncbi:MFS transporter [Altererythrobacter sp. CC-YST694]|uniref:MFS transporter n=1 Tax=Altererythrobacter sp. CC-YST694 TaxID=2755038 RepID=UPI001D018274|nr:MFS transporter [Altererythrobacter sp. CC-YST694]MCB5424999.1 MFS transporter [Altererythrobacter sp. CC-YST694]
MRSQRSSSGYQILLVTLLCLNFGILFFDRNALNFLMPFVQPELGLNYTQVGMLGSALSLTWAIAAIFVGWLSDKAGKRKILIVLSTLLFSACSVVSGFASSFLMLLGARLVMGLSEGGVMPISHAMVAAEVSPKWRALAMGVTQNVGSSLLGSTVAPLVLVPVALTWGWREAFFLAAVPGLISALLIVLFVVERPIPKAAPRQPRTRAPLVELLTNRNVVACTIMAVLLVSYLVVTWAFMPLVLVQYRGIDEATAAGLMAVLGVSSFLASFVVTTISDFVGRRPVMVISTFIGVLLPLGALYFDGPVMILGVIFFVGWMFNGIFPMFMATVPTESVAPYQVATAMGLVMGVGEILGGVLSPFVAGWLSDIYGLQAPLWFLIVLAVLGGATALFLRETAPRIVGERAEADPA